jgi:hypothetical protein
MAKDKFVIGLYANGREIGGRELAELSDYFQKLELIVSDLGEVVWPTSPAFRYAIKKMFLDPRVAVKAPEMLLCYFLRFLKSEDWYEEKRMEIWKGILEKMSPADLEYEASLAREFNADAVEFFRRYGERYEILFVSADSRKAVEVAASEIGVEKFLAELFPPERYDEIRERTRGKNALIISNNPKDLECCNPKKIFSFDPDEDFRKLFPKNSEKLV